MTPPRIVILDAIETLFSLAPVRERLRAAGTSAAALDIWFARLLRDAFAITAIGGYAGFREVAEPALRSVLADNQVAATEELVEELFEAFSALPIHDDGAPAIEAVSSPGIPVYVLTNGTRETTESLLEAAGIDGLISGIVTVHDVGRWTPAPEPYLHAAHTAGVEPSEAALVAVTAGTSVAPGRRGCAPGGARGASITCRLHSDRRISPGPTRRGRARAHRRLSGLTGCSRQGRSRWQIEVGVDEVVEVVREDRPDDLQEYLEQL